MTSSPPIARPLTAGLALCVLGLAVSLVGLYLYDSQRKQAAEAAALNAGQPAPLAVVVAAAIREPVARKVETIGTVVADNQVLVAAEVAGRITKVHFRSGQQVEAGTALVQLNDGPARSELQRRNVALKLARTDLERAKRLHGHTLSSADYERYVAAYDEARALVAQSEEVLSQRLVKAPFTGELGVRRINLGQYVQAGTPIVTLTDNRVLHVDFNVPERYRDLLQTGLGAQARGQGQTPLQARATVTAIDPQVDEATRAIRVRATLAPDARITPGQFVHVALELSPGPAAISVPTVALESSLTGDRLYVLRQDGEQQKVQLLSVATGTQNADRTELPGTSLSAGDWVVVSGQINLQDGALVTTRRSETPTSDEPTIGSYHGKKE